MRREPPDVLRAALLAVLPELLSDLGYAPAARAEVTYSRDHLPPGYASPEAFAAECRRLRLSPEEYRPARSWAIPSSVWERARREDRERRRKPVEPEADPVDAMLAGSGLRLVRGAK